MDTTLTFQVHTLESAPEPAKPLMQGLQQSLGMVPNLAATMAESPALLHGFLSLRKTFYSGAFTPLEVQVVALTNAFENGCAYCMALHTALAHEAGVCDADVEALRQGRPPATPKVGALSDYSRALVQRRGQVDDRHLQAFLAAGYSRAQALEVVLGVAVSILPNYAHHLTQCAVDDAFAAHRWTSPR